jgi:hypothetical protein
MLRISSLIRIICLSTSVLLIIACTGIKQDTDYYFALDERGILLTSEQKVESVSHAVPYTDSVVLLERTMDTVFYYGEPFRFADSAMCFWCKVQWQDSIVGWTLCNVLKKEKPMFEKTLKEPSPKMEVDNQWPLVLQINESGETAGFTQNELIDVLCASAWEYGYTTLNFSADGKYTRSIQDTEYGFWMFNNPGEILLFDSEEANEPSGILNFETRYILTGYADERYISGDAPISNESEIFTQLTSKEIPLSEVTSSDILGLWVTEEHGPMGERFGFQFTEEGFTMGHVGIDKLYNEWSSISYPTQAYWDYVPEENLILVNFSSDFGSNNTTAELQLVQFFNGAFKGKYSVYIDEIEPDYERTFYKAGVQ